MTSSHLNVSRETFDRLQCYHDLLLKWSQKINLISKSSYRDLWDRHIWDSAQAYNLVDLGRTWTDIGSGGGLPGLVIAILSRENNPVMRVKLIESDMRKAVFLRTVIRELDLNAEVTVSRIESTSPAQSDVLSARALADLSALLPLAQRHLKPSGVALLFKGVTWEKEVEIARKSWSFELKAHTSKTSAQSAILEVRDIQHA
ncbi:16S rRNA (guanine(527)-N(7))-methyltransferase RsmG [Roseobacter sp.]|uniref:16S rRNA (guanine(527)-N(7))-methyltransferase RsmG n=1 Tax=Roseobacter sp. TaxID=1907202 RepID=UPI00329929CD